MNTPNIVISSAVEPLQEPVSNPKYAKGIGSLPQIEFLDSLLAKLQNPESISSLFSGADREKFQDGQIDFDVLIENQRGSFVFGIPVFSLNSLISPFDPPRYQTMHGNAITDLNLYPLPDMDWKWSWPWWCILMVGDVDEQGFVYSRSHFNSKHWKGVYKVGNCIRRRVWIRKREKMGLKGGNHMYRSMSTLLSSTTTRTTTMTPSATRTTTQNTVDGLKLKKIKRRAKLKNRITRGSSRRRRHEDDGIIFINNDTSLDYRSDSGSMYSLSSDQISSDEIEEESVESAIRGMLESTTRPLMEPLNEPLNEPSIALDSLIEPLVAIFLLQISKLKLDREKIERVMRFIFEEGPVVEVCQFLIRDNDKCLRQVLSSFDHLSSGKVMISKLEVVNRDVGGLEHDAVSELIRHLVELSPM